MSRPATLGQLKESGYQSVSVKDEMRRNLIRKLRAGEELFPGIIGYDKTVIPQIISAVLSKHDFLLLGLRGQAKTRLIRMLPALLDDYLPIVKDSPLNEDPFRPLLKRTRVYLIDRGDDAEIEWIPRERRYQEKLATPDVSIADLIGDIDPIKAVSRRLDFSDEEVIHFGIIPRTNRGIFAINELPDLQSRIQVGLLNIMEEKDIQIRGFPVRLPLDVCLVFTANPEDYTNRGNIITPLKDRIDAQIMTHYPEKPEDAMRITAQEAWTKRDSLSVNVHPLLREIIEGIGVQARGSDFVDRSSGVSARMAISFLETLCGCAEARALRQNEPTGQARILDVFQSLPALTGKIELVYKGEQEGPLNVAFHLAGRAVREAFNARALEPVTRDRKGKERKADFSRFQSIIDWFEAGNVLELGSEIPHVEYVRRLEAIEGIRGLALGLGIPCAESDVCLLMEFIIEGLHQNFLLTKQVADARIRYSDAVNFMMNEVSE